MGYDLHITRAQDWTDTREHRIRSVEWMEYVGADPELDADPSNGQYSVLWKGQGVPSGSWFDWSDGNIYTTNPNRAVLKKMLQIAVFFGARVQGDNGEVYRKAEDLPA